MRDWWILPWLVDLFFTTERLGFSRGWWICFSQLRDWDSPVVTRKDISTAARGLWAHYTYQQRF